MMSFENLNREGLERWVDRGRSEPIFDCRNEELDQKIEELEDKPPYKAAKKAKVLNLITEKSLEDKTDQVTPNPPYGEEIETPNPPYGDEMDKTDHGEGEGTDPDHETDPTEGTNPYQVQVNSGKLERFTVHPPRKFAPRAKHKFTCNYDCCGALLSGEYYIDDNDSCTRCCTCISGLDEASFRKMQFDGRQLSEDQRDEFESKIKRKCQWVPNTKTPSSPLKAGVGVKRKQVENDSSKKKKRVKKSKSKTLETIPECGEVEEEEEEEEEGNVWILQEEEEGNVWIQYYEEELDKANSFFAKGYAQEIKKFDAEMRKCCNESVSEFIKLIRRFPGVCAILYPDGDKMHIFHHLQAKKLMGKVEVVGVEGFENESAVKVLLSHPLTKTVTMDKGKRNNDVPSDEELLKGRFSDITVDDTDEGSICAAHHTFEEMPKGYLLHPMHLLLIHSAHGKSAEEMAMILIENAKKAFSDKKKGFEDYENEFDCLLDLITVGDNVRGYERATQSTRKRAKDMLSKDVTCT